MTEFACDDPGARVQAAVELLDAIIDAARAGGAAADTLIARYFATRRYAGSKDRRAVRELVYAAIRRTGEVPTDGRAAMLGLADEDAAVADAFDGSPHGPAPIRADEPRTPAGIAPAWLEAALDGSDVPRAGWAALVARAPLDLRVNTLRLTVEAAQAALPETERIAGVPDALRLPTGTAIERHPLFLDGGVEVQDAGSQLIALAAGATPGMTVVDLCAGAGGKTLALASAMGGQGALIACDIDRARLSRLAPRAERAGAGGIVTRLLDPGREAEALADLAGRADVVLVDAPCSGTGTWRRNPEARWRLTPDRLARLVASQAHVLEVARALVRPGGTLVYAVCSVLDAEGADQVAPLVAPLETGGWTPEPLPVGNPRGAGVRLTPAEHGTDGFFLARLRRPC